MVYWCICALYNHFDSTPDVSKDISEIDVGPMRYISYPGQRAQKCGHRPFQRMTTSPSLIVCLYVAYWRLLQVALLSQRGRAKLRVCQ